MSDLNNQLLFDTLKRIEEKQDETLSSVNEIGNRVTALETKTEPLFDNGQPGEISLLKTDVKGLRDSRTWFLGAIAGIEMAMHGGAWILHKLGMR